MKPRWPRFSLRTLVIAVFGIALCWTLTATWGVKSVASSLPYGSARPRSCEWRDRIFHIEATNEDGQAFVFDSRVSAIAPFLVTEKTEMSGTGSVNVSFERTYFWLFGFCCEIFGPPTAIQKK